MSRRGSMGMAAFEYREAGQKEHAGLRLVEIGERRREESDALDAMRREMERSREAAVAEVESRLRQEAEIELAAVSRKMGTALERFDEERRRYFAGVEQEVVGLALGIARKVLQREAELDPTLLGALVRIALERMEAGSDVRVRVSPAEVERWRSLAAEWEVIGDAALTPGDCLVETGMGRANFGFEAQLAGVEQTLQRLMSQRAGAA